MKIMTALLLVVSSCLAFAAEPSESVSKFNCKSTDAQFTMVGIRSECKDPRYKTWQKNGCYDVTVQIGQNVNNYELLRELDFSQELRQHFYSFFAYNKEEAIMQGIGLEMVASDGHPPRAIFDIRKNDMDPFTRYHSYCEIEN